MKARSEGVFHFACKVAWGAVKVAFIRLRDGCVITAIKQMVDHQVYFCLFNLIFRHQADNRVIVLSEMLILHYIRL